MQKMSQASFCFKKPLNEVKASGMHFSFNIFWQDSTWIYIKVNCLKFQTANPEIC